MGEVLPLRRPDHEPVREAPATDRPEPLWRESSAASCASERPTAASGSPTSPSGPGVSPQYLSEVERGLKDPSSELLAAVAGALGLTVGDLATRVARPAAPSVPSASPPDAVPGAA